MQPLRQTPAHLDQPHPEPGVTSENVCAVCLKRKGTGHMWDPIAKAYRVIVCARCWGDLEGSIIAATVAAPRMERA